MSPSALQGGSRRAWDAARHRPFGCSRPSDLQRPAGSPAAACARDQALAGHACLGRAGPRHVLVQSRLHLHTAACNYNLKPKVHNREPSVNKAGRQAHARPKKQMTATLSHTARRRTFCISFRPAPVLSGF
jgi:hypothetical protein